MKYIIMLCLLFAGCNSDFHEVKRIEGKEIRKSVFQTTDTNRKEVTAFFPMTVIIVENKQGEQLAFIRTSLNQRIYISLDLAELFFE